MSQQNERKIEKIATHSSHKMLRARFLTDAKWLVANLNKSQLKILDASWLLTSLKRDARAEFEKEHIPGSRFFDLDAISDTTSPYPHMLPSPELFGDKVGKLGVANNDHVVVYDTLGLFSAARCWYMFRGFGHEQVSVLNGGLKAYKAAGGVVTSQPTEIVPVHYVATPFDRNMLRLFEDIIENEKSNKELVVDARPAPRFKMEVDEPRVGLPRGRIENSVNVPSGSIVDAEGVVKSDDELRKLFVESGVDGKRPIVVSCGSGVTACVTGFAAYISGVTDVPPPLYDGAYTEYAMRKLIPQQAQKK